MTERPASIAIISSMARSMTHYRGLLIHALSERGFKVFALAPDHDEGSRAGIRRLGAMPVDFSLDRTGMNPLRDMADLLRLVRMLQRLRPDLVLNQSIKPVLYGTTAAWMAGVPRRFGLIPGLGYVFTPSGDGVSVHRRLLRVLASAMYWGGLRGCERVFFHNADDLETFIAKSLLQRSKTAIISGTGVDLAHFAPAPPVQRPVTFLLMARLLREKGIREYAEAARRVKARHPDTRFILLGGFDPNPGCFAREEIEDWVRDGILEWPGPADDVRPWIAQSSVYVLPSYREGLPRSTQEAMAMGRPVITTDAVGCRETVEDGVNGFLVPVRDVAALAAAMLRFIENPALIESMGRESRRLAEEKFDVHKINAIMLEAMGIRSQGDSFPHARD